ncbi:MAG: MBL fold metallo-hydrolase [Oscillospiraceae bacterium]|nr:MBL fold metallo-hydrolase [Oscillospiraceae bacterium]
MKLTFLGAAHEVTGSCTLLEACGKRILVDCGMEQGADIYENRDLPVKPDEIDCVLLTHAHLDHAGRLPTLTKNGYGGSIYATEATVRLCDIMLRDSAHIQEQEAEWRNRKAQRAGEAPCEPVYTVADVAAMMPHFVSCRYEQVYPLFDGVSIRFFDAGHLLGSASIELTITENGETRILLFSGDVGNTNRPLVRDPQKPTRADFVVIESTYGDRLHAERRDYEAQFAAILKDTFERGGNLVIPAFAVGRTQEMLYLIHGIKQKNLVPGHADFPVWLDSPLAIEATEIYATGLNDYYDDDMRALLAQGINPLKFNDLHLAVTTDESKAINSDPTPKVIISASGMCEAGRIRHHLKHNLWRKDSTVMFVGFQAAGTLGRLLLDGEKSVRLFSERIEVNAKIEQMDGISGHADRDMLLGWLGNIQKKPQRVFVNHGEDKVCDIFAGEVRDKLGMEAVAPYSGGSYDLLTGECLDEGNKVPLEKPEAASGAESGAAAQENSPFYRRLSAAGERLADVVRKNAGLANAESQKFENEIAQLCDRWDRA